MDRLLRYFLQQFIRRGAMTFTTASGVKFSCGDENRRAGFRAFPDHRCRAPGSAQPRTRARRSLHGRHLRRRAWLDRGRAGDPDGPTGNIAALCQAAMVAAISGQAYQAVQSAPVDRKTMSPTTTTSTGGSIRFSSIPTSSTAAAILRKPEATLDDASARQEAAHRRQAPDPARRQGARHRLGVGRPWSVSGRNDRRQRDRRHPVDRTTAGLERPRRRKEI